MIEQVTVSQLPQWLQAAHQDGQPAQVLDVREADELQVAAIAPAAITAIQGAFVHIPMSQLAARVGELDPELPVACLCHHGGRSQRVAMYLAQQGFAKVANIAGGIDAWSREVDASVPRY
ncbi:MAG: Thiosulfate sulfurtransferase GlpE [Paracidovorax wautersii]|uniref:Thiosulfate sulfurtransferase GlpE n=1 Tax=Paracidovorax wautersii TaxID=1177982 RepID=A0A7V8JQ00_9BURK|nr:MAG: Thiosulfate sulfurtransferase GlpE [Paracidovorax wautersii]